jgi:FkbM family methyltransferase
MLASRQELGTMTIRDLFFMVRHGFRGVPIQIAGRTYRFDESLRRWSFDGEPEVRDAVVAHLDEGDTAIDIGANFGMHTLLMADRIGPSGRLLAFEPIPENLRLLKRNLALNKFGDRVTVAQMALSDQPVETIQMVVNSHSLEPSASLQTETTQGRESVVVKNISLDRAAAGISADRNCFVKLDVEGAELSVLRSGQNFLRRVKPRLLIEVHDYALPQFGDSTEAVYDFLRAFGYSINRISDMSNPNGGYHHIMAFPS